MPPMSFQKPGSEAAPAATTAAIVETVVTSTTVAGAVVGSVNTAAPGCAPCTAPVPTAPTQQALVTQEVLLYRPPVLKDGSVKEAGTPPVRFTILGFRKTRFAEYVPGGGKGIIVKTEAEVRANGGTTSYDEHKLKGKDGMKKFDPLAEALVAIEKPESYADDDTVFVYACGGKKFALALWSMKRMSYTNGAKVLFTKRAMGVLSKGYPTYSFGVSSKWKPVGETNGSFIPVFSEPIKHTPEFLAWAEQVKNPSAAESTGGEE